MPQKLPNRGLFCKGPKSKRGIAEAKKRWRELVRGSATETVNRFLEKRDRRVPHERFRALKALDAAQPEALYRLVTTNLPRCKNLLEFLLSEIALLRNAIATIATPPPEGGLQPIFTQEFEGIVTSSTETEVTVEFTVEDDPEVRTFALANLDAPGWVLEKGQAVRARCHLEVIPPTKPMSEEERRKWKQQYRDVEGYLKKDKRGKDLL